MDHSLARATIDPLDEPKPVFSNLQTSRLHLNIRFF